MSNNPVVTLNQYAYKGNSYNITGLEDRPIEESEFDFVIQQDENGDLKKKKRKHGHRHKDPKSDCSKKENEDKPHCVFKRLPRYYSKYSPSRSNQPLTPLGYTQFYLPDVDNVDEGKPPKWEIEYSTYKPSQLLPPGNGSLESWLEGPVPRHLLPGYDEELFKDGWDWMTLDESDDEEGGSQGDDDELQHDIDDNNEHNDDEGKRVGEDKDEELAKKRKKFKKNLKTITPWKMKDLTINSYVKLSRKLVAQRKMWDKFSELM